MLDFLRLGVFSELAKLQDRQRQRSLEEAMLGERKEDREDQKHRRQLEDVLTDARLRDVGYVPESEASPDAKISAVSGRMLDELVGAAGGGGMTFGMPDAEIDRYAPPIGGYRRDRMFVPPQKPKEPSFSERRGHELQSRIRELTDGGMGLAEANRQARMELGQAVAPPRAPGAVRAGSESAATRDNRRAADRDLRALNATSRELSALNREIGTYPDREDSTSGRIGRRSRLQFRRDSLQSEFDRHSSAANAATLGQGGSNYGLPISPSAGSAMQRELREARQAYEQSLAMGADTVRTKRLYTAVVDAIRARYRAPGVQ